MKFVLIDDSEPDRFLTRRVLARLDPDAEIVEFASCIDAIELVCTATEPLIVFLDINLPRMTGFEFLERVGSEIDERPVSIIILTSSSSLDDRRKAAPYRCVDDHVEKPLSKNRLVEVLDALDGENPT